MYTYVFPRIFFFENLIKKNNIKHNLDQIQMKQQKFALINYKYPFTGNYCNKSKYFKSYINDHLHII